MSRKKKRFEEQASPFGFYPEVRDPNYQANIANTATYRLYLDWLIDLAVSRFTWHGLPETVNVAYFERTLVLEGHATISTPLVDTADDVQLFGTKATPTRLDLYGYPAEWRAVAEIGQQWDVSPDNGVFVYDNRNRHHRAADLQQYAWRLANLERARDVNLLHRRNPVLIQMPESRQADARRLWADIQTHKEVIFTHPDMLSDTTVSALGTNVPYLGQELEETKLKIFNEVFNYLGVANANTEKKERLVVDEAQASRQQVSLRLQDSLLPRMEAAKRLNRIFRTNVTVEITPTVVPSEKQVDKGNTQDA